MMQYNRVRFDELDKKLLKEMPIITEVLTATTNKIVRFLAPYYDDMHNFLSTELRRHKGWRLDSTQKNVIYPFVTDYRTRSITELEPEYWVYNGFTCTKKQGQTFEVELGYTCQVSNEPPSNHFFFGVFNANLRMPVFRDDFSHRFNMARKGFKTRIWSPIDDESEGFQVQCSEPNEKKIDALYNRFKDKMLRPFLKSLT